MILTISLILPFCSAGMLVAGSHLINTWYLLTRTCPDFIHKFFTLHLSVFVHVSLHISLHLCPNRIPALAAQLRNSSIIHAAARLFRHGLLTWVIVWFHSYRLCVKLKAIYKICMDYIVSNHQYLHSVWLSFPGVVTSQHEQFICYAMYPLPRAQVQVGLVHWAANSLV